MAKTVQEKVEQALKTNEKARNSDRVLMGIIWQQEGFNMTDEQKKLFMELTNPESIRRERQKFQEKGLYPASKEVDDARFKKYQEVQGGHKEVSQVLGYKKSVDENGRPVMILN